MAEDRTQAVVLRNLEFSETSRIVTFACPGRGRMACMAKGAQRPKSPLRGLLDTFNHVEMVYYWKDNRAIQTLGEVSLIQNFRGLKSDLAKSAYAAFALEITDRMMQENEPSEELYNALLTGIQQLDTWNGDVPTHGCWQAIRVLAAGGHEPGVGQCHNCGAALPESPWFDYAAGFACATCRGGVRMSPADAHTLRALVTSLTECPSGVTAGNGVYRVITNFARRQVETEFRSTGVIQQLYG